MVAVTMAYEDHEIPYPTFTYHYGFLVVDGLIKIPVKLCEDESNNTGLAHDYRNDALLVAADLLHPGVIVLDTKLKCSSKVIKLKLFDKESGIYSVDHEYSLMKSYKCKARLGSLRRKARAIKRKIKKAEVKRDETNDIELARKAGAISSPEKYKGILRNQCALDDANRLIQELITRK